MNTIEQKIKELSEREKELRSLMAQKANNQSLNPQEELNDLKRLSSEILQTYAQIAALAIEQAETLEELAAIEQNIKPLIQMFQLSSKPTGLDVGALNETQAFLGGALEVLTLSNALQVVEHSSATQLLQATFGRGCIPRLSCQVPPQ
ncbi:hypothetical protein [Leptolyngbya ohadii]|uniref:hypothetical protein n=1 Tax=Leptolyngbya ohadii TaxID=1962290 RepID=UPI000B59932A|nr:hypothetical protein [Leptolyngbya ohadii]